MPFFLLLMGLTFIGSLAGLLGVAAGLMILGLLVGAIIGAWPAIAFVLLLLCVAFLLHLIVGPAIGLGIVVVLLCVGLVFCWKQKSGVLSDHP